MAGLKDEITALILASNNNAGAWYSKQVQLDVRKRVMICLRAEIPEKVVVCRKDIHGGSWEQYEKHFSRQNGNHIFLTFQS
jgi:hypothetical protein